MKLSAIRPIALVLSRELGLTVLLLIGVSFVVFIILYLSPGDPFSVLLEGQLFSAETRAGVREALGVPKAWYAQYISWLAGMLHGNFGTSIRTGLPVLSEMLRVGFNTLILTIGSMFVTVLIAVPIALYSAVRGTNKITWFLTMFAYVISALPVFWFGYIVLYIFMHKFGLFPLAFGGLSSQKFSWLYALLPIFVLGIGNGTISEVIRSLRAEMGRVMAEDYIRTAKAKGASVWKHSFKEGLLIPVTEIIASKIPFILGGAVIVEQVFNWPGMGRMAWQAAQDRDYPVIMGIAILAAVFVRMGSLFQSMVYVAVNPRASKERE
ncbi:MAG TPA: ABC transporter permease [Nitrospirota bacterium]|nr:ABC transporter permease [Nitrospirota bacterium]